MNVSLTPQLEQMVREKVESGSYNNASEVVREALRLVQKRDRHDEWLRVEIQKGLDDIEAGRIIEADDSYFDRVDREVEEELEQEQ